MATKYLTDHFMARLKEAVPVNLTHYASAEKWIDKFASGEHYAKETGIICGDLGVLRLPDSHGNHDDENAIRIHTALSSLTPVQAIDERLWTYLTHCVWHEYMTKRWEVNAADDSKAINLVIRRYFFQGHGLNGIALNGISRLWWAAHMTHDADRDDPYELTRVFISKSDIVTGLMERSIGKNRKLLCVFVEFLRDNISEIEEKWTGAGGPGKAVQQMARELNRRGGVVLLDAVDKAGIHAIMRRVMIPPT